VCHPAPPGRAQQHGHAARHGVAVPVFWLAHRDSPWVHGRTLLPHVRALPCFALLGARGFLEPQIFLEIAREILFSIETW